MSTRVYKLLNGSELLVSEEVMGVRQSPDGIPITVDGDYVIDDVLKLVDVGNEAARELEYAKKQVIFWNDEAVRLREEVEKWKALAEAKVVFASNGNNEYQYELQEDNIRLRKELEEARTFKFPRQTVPSGWHLKFGYLLKIQEKVQQETGHTIELEEIEALLLTLERVGQEGEGNQDE